MQNAQFIFICVLPKNKDIKLHKTTGDFLYIRLLQTIDTYSMYFRKKNF